MDKSRKLDAFSSISRLDVEKDFTKILAKKDRLVYFCVEFAIFMKKSEKTRQLIIEKSAVLFNQKGYSGTSMSDIMEATGLSKGGVYGNFKKEGMSKDGVKEEIALAAFEFAVFETYKEIGRRTKVISNSLDKLKAVVYFYRERVLNPPIEGGCPIQNTAVDSDDVHPVLRAKVEGAVNEWHRRIVRNLEKGLEKGEVKKDVDPDEFATLFIGNLEGGILLARIRRSVRPFEIMSDQLLRLIEELRP